MADQSSAASAAESAPAPAPAPLLDLSVTTAPTKPNGDDRFERLLETDSAYIWGKRFDASLDGEDAPLVTGVQVLYEGDSVPPGYECVEVDLGKSVRGGVFLCVRRSSGSGGSDAASPVVALAVHSLRDPVPASFARVPLEIGRGTRKYLYVQTRASLRDGKVARRWHLGDLVDCKDSVNKWEVGRIVRIDYEQRRLFVHYEGWTDRWSEWVSMDATDRVQPYMSRTHGLRRPLPSERKKQPVEMWGRALTEMRERLARLRALMAVPREERSEEDVAWLHSANAESLRDVLNSVVADYDVIDDVVEYARLNMQLLAEEMRAPGAMPDGVLLAMRQLFDSDATANKFFRWYGMKKAAYADKDGEWAYRPPATGGKQGKKKKPPSSWHIALLNQFGELGGFDALSARLKAESGEFPLRFVEMHTFVRSFWGSRRALRVELFERMVGELSDAISKRVLELSDEELKVVEKKSFKELMTYLEGLQRETAGGSEPQFFEMLELDFSLRLLSTRLLRKRILGIGEIQYMLQRVRARDVRPDRYARQRIAPTRWLTDEHAAEWIIERNLIGTLFGPSTHPELIKRSFPIVQTLAAAGRLTDKHLAIIHDSCAGKHESHVLIVYDIIARTVPLLVQKPELIATAFDRIKAGTPLYQYKAMHLDFLKKFTINAVAATRGLPVNERSWFGLDIMWQLAQDNSGVSNELAIAALETLCELLAHADYVRAREHHIKAALESVRNGTSVAQALLLLQGLSERAGCSRLVKELAQHEEHGSLLDQVVADLKRVMAQANEVKTSLGEAASSGRAGAGPAQSSMHLDLLPPENGVTPGGPDGDDDLPAPPPSSVGGGSPAPVSASPAPGAANKPSGWDAFFLVGRFQHARQIDVRLEFIEFVLDRSLFQLSREQVDSMWASCVTDHVSANDTSRLLAFLAEGRDTESAHLRIGHAKPTGCAYFEPDVTDHIFHDLLCNPDKFDLAAISPDGYVCLEMYFHMVAVAAGAIQLAGAGVNSHAHHRSKKFVVLDFASLSERGVEAYWRLLAEAKHREVFEQASSFLLALHVRLSDSLDGAARRAIYRRFVERCIALLRDASASVEGGQELETMRPKIVRTVLLLGSFLAQVEQTSYCPDMSSVPVGNASIRIAVQIYKGRRRISSRVVLLPGSQSIASLRRQLAKNLKCQPPTLQFEYRGRILYPEEYDHLTVSEARIRGGAIEEIVVTCLPDGTPNCRPARDESARAAAATAASGSSDASVLEQLEPRDLLANNAPYFDMLFRLLRLGGPVARQVWRLLDWLPVNSLLETHVARAVGLADDGDAAEAAAAIDWSVILDASSPLRLLYVLQILDKHLLVGENASAATQTRVQAARQAFIDNGGLVQLHRILVELDLDAVFADSMPQQCLAHLLSLVAHLEESVTEEHRAAGLGRPAGEEAESTAAVRLLGMLHATATSDLTARELEERARQLEAEKQQQGAGFADDSSDDEASTTAAADSSDDEDEADGGAEDVGLTTVASIQAKLADQILSTLRSLFTSSPARLGTLFDNAAQLEETLQAALLQHPSRELRKCVAAGVCALCEQFAVKAGAEPNAAVERTPRAVVLPIAVRVVDRLTPDMFCRELFELLQALVAMDDVASADAFDPEGLGRKLANKIVDHPIVEVNPHDRDEMLQGLLRSMQALVQQHEALKEPLAEEASLLESLFSDCLFKYPESKLKGVLWPPKCKSETSRREAFALLAELAKGSEKNFRALLALIEPNHLEPHSTGHVFQQWDFEPRREIQSDTGYVGLKNLGCICYMNSTIQQLFMLPALRKNILTIDQETIEPPPEDQGNDEDAAAGDASAVAPASDATAAVTPGGVPEAEKEKEKDEEPDSDAEDMVPFGMSPSQSNSWFFQLQYIFGFLQESQRQYANPGGFCHTFTDWEGNPTNVHEQMDADEFLNLLFDRLDTKVNGTPYETTLRDSLGGSFAQQMIGHGKCVHAREREEKFYVVSLAIQNKRTLEEALEAFIAGEMMEGDNALNCDGCGTKADTLKRSCLKELGPTVIFHLKRFEFDFDLMRKRKLNDRLEFPRKINLFPYTKEGLAESERRERGQQAGAVEDEDEAKADDDEEDVEVEDGDGVQTEEDAEAARQAAAEAERRAVLEAEPKDAGYYEYELSGVLVHTGSADRGHYYSFIRERLEPEELAAGRKPRWFQFNDTIVRPFDPRRLEDECFGGEVEQTIGGRWGGSTRRKIAKYRNAYMLFYDRVVPVQGGDSSAATAADEAEPEAAEDLPDAGQHDQLVARVRRQKSFVQVPVPPAIYSKVWEENKTFWRDRFIFDPVYFEFAGDVVSALQIEPTRALPAPGDGNDDMGELVTRVSARFVFETLARARRKESFSQWILRLHQLVRASGPATSWMLRRLAMEPGAAGRPESEEVSDWSLDFLMRSTTKAVRRQTAALFADVVAQGVSYVSSEDEWTGAVPRFSAVDLLYSYADHLCSLLKDAAANWKRFDRYFQVCQEMANAHPRLAQRMVGNRMVARMIDLVLGDASPHKEISDIAVDPRTKRRPAIGNQYVNPVFTNYLELLATLVCAAHPSTERRAELPATTFIGAERKAKRRSRWHYRDDEGRELYGSVDGALCDCVLDAVDVDMLANVKFLDWLCSQGTTRRRGLAVCEVLCHVAWGNIEFSRVVVGCSTRGLRRVGARDVRSFLRVLTALATMRDGDATPAYGGGDFDSDLNAQLASVHPSQRKQKMAELRAAKEKELADKLGGRSLEVLNDGLPQHNKERVAVVMEGLTGVMQAQQGYYWMTRVCIDHVVRMAKQSPAVQEWLHAHPDVTGWMNDFATMWQREPTAYESRIRLWKHDYYDRRPKPNQSGLSNKQVRAALAEISAGVPVNDNGVEDSDEEFRASRTFEVGQWIDCRDTVDKWLEARITAVDEQNRQVSISYDGWPAKWDETLDWDDDRIQRFGRHTSDRPDKKKKGAGPRIKDHLGEGRLFAGPARAPKAPKKKKGKKS